jgi:transcriptional regulator with XRE-family HTH domain
MIESPKRPKIVGNFIRQRREVLGLSQRALGLLFDPPVTTQFISNVERGVTPLPPAHVPTLTRALQVSEAEMMSLLEKEYTHKLSGRLGLNQEDGAAARSGAVVIPMTAVNGGASQSSIAVSPHDHAFMQALYEAYQGADAKTRQAFASACHSMLNARVSGNASVVAVAAAQPGIALSGGDRSQG